MIPTIGLMVGAYVLFRCFETLLFPANRYGSSMQHALAIIAALVTAGVTLLCLLSLLASGRNAGSGLP